MLFGASACGPGDSTAPWVATARPATIRTHGSPVAPTQVKLTRQVRRGLCLGVGNEVHVAVPAGAEQVVFGFGPRSAPRTDVHGRLRFLVRAASGPPAAPAFEAIVDATEARWHDARAPIRLAEGEELVLTSEMLAEGDGAGVEACWGGLVFLARSREAASRPNVILLSLDTLGARHLSSFDGPTGASPAMDALLERGHQFRRAMAPYPNTLVSHSSLFSGKLPSHHGRFADTGFASGLPDLASLVAPLAAAGHVTAAFTENAYVGSGWGFAHGFDLYDNGDSGRLDLIPGDARGTFAKGIAWLDAQAPETRFFLFLHTYEVHAPYVPADEPGRRFADALTPDDHRTYKGAHMGLRMLQQANGPVFDARDTRRLRALYTGEINALDREIAALLHRLDDRGLLANTLLVVTSDHGESFGGEGLVGHGHTLHNGVLHVPLSFVWEGHVAPGVTEDPVQLVDVLPTVLDLVGVPPPPGLDGRSLAAAILARGEPLPVRPAFAELRRKTPGCTGAVSACLTRLEAVQTARFKLVRARDGGTSRLYDLDADPAETTDVAGAHPDVVRALEEALATTLRPDDAAPAATRDAPLDPAMRDRLRALGYVADE